MTGAARADLVARRLAAAREVARDTGRSGPAAGLPRRPPGVEVLSPQQESIWLADRVAGGTGEYNVSQVLRVRGPLDEDALRLAVGIVMERHEVLRTRYATRDGHPVPVVSDLPSSPVTADEADGVEADGVEAAVARAADLAAVPFDLAREAPIRAHLLRVADDDRLLVLVVHHIAVDGWAMGVLMEELSDIYAALVAGNVPSRPDLPVQYADYAHWQRGRLDGGRAERDLAYWRGRLAGLEPARLPTESGPAGRLARLDVAVPDALAGGVHRVAAAYGATAFQVLLAAFQALLARWTGGTDIAVGTLLAARDHAALEGLIGFFGTTVVIRTDLSGDPAFGALVVAVRDAVFAAHDHGDLPFDRVVAALRPARDPASHPLFQVMFTLADDEAAPLRLTGCAIEAVPVAAGPAKFDLEVIVTRSQAPDGAPRLAVAVEYAAGRFTAPAVDRIAHAYLRLLTALTDDPQRPVTAAELLSAAELERLAVDFNDSARPFPRDALVHELIAAQAARTPDAVAVHTGRGDAMTYGALDARANRLAHRLRAAGAGPGTTVGVRLPRTPDLVVALLGVLKTGAAYVPVDPDHPADRIAHVLADSRARLLVTDTSGDAGVATVGLDGLDAHPDTPLPRAASPEDLAYLIYTSGSTGRPKGAMVPHRAVVNLSLAYAELVDLGPDDVVGAVATHAFDLSVPELLTTLMTGAVIALASRSTATDGAALGRFVDAHGVTVMQTTPTTWRMLLDAGWAGGPLRAGASGEPVPADLAAALSARVARMWCLYGPTETTVWSTGAPVTEIVPGRLMPVGRPLANNRVYVCDDRMRPVPIGVTGEICIGGDGVSRGYAHQPALTADRYVPDPFTPGGRLYRSGDLGRVRDDGVIEFVGRADTQVKIRGNRVELGEVEAVLSDHPDVVAAAARTWGEGPDIRLVAYAVWRGAPAGADEVRAHLRTRLPDAMLPAVVVDLAELPLTPNLKVDRRALPPPPDAPAAAHVPPRTDREQLVVDVWSAVLGHGSVGVDDDFFALGGHSLRGLAVAARLGAAIGAEIPLRTLFTHPTPRRLAAALAGLDRAAPRQGPVPARPDGVPAPLSAVQRRLWFLDRLRPGHGEYQVPSVTRLRGPLDTARLAAAIGEVAAAHDALRVRFADGDTAELVAPAEVAVTEAAGEAEARAIVDADIARPFDLGAGPPLRARVIRLAADDHVVVLVAHHAAVDGWSLRLIRAEIAERYAGAPVTRPALDYRDYAYWQAGADADLDHWRDRLAGLPACELPTDAPRTPAWSGRAGRVEFALPDGASEALRALARDRRATVFMVLLAAFEAVVAWYAGQPDVVLGTPVAGRTRPEFDGVVGCFVNTIVVRGDTGGDPTFDALVDRVRTALLADLTHQDVPFERLVDALRPERDLSRNPLFQIMFRADDAPPAGPGPGGTRAEPWDTAPAGAKFDLNVAVDDTADRIAGTIEYAADLFDAVTAERVARAYVGLLVAAGRTPRARLSALCDATTGGPPDRGEADSLPERIARQARLTPAATAVVHGDARWDYATLDGRANRIAHALRDGGVHPGAIVGVCLPRGPELVATLLGVLRAGAAYLPLDPAAPPARRDAMLAGATRLVTGDPWDAPVPAVRPPGGADPEPPRVDHSPDQPFGVFFTSGSTGTPKGVVTLHRGVAAFLDYLAGPVGLRAGDIVLQLAAVTFDASIRDMLAPLAFGATVVLVDDARDAYRLREAMAAHRVTVIASAVPTLLRMLTTIGGGAPDLRLVMASGEPLTRELVRAVHRLAPSARVVNQYGPTETTMIATWYAVDDDAGDAPVPIGRPIPGAAARVLSPTGSPLPTGALGDLYLAGPGLTGGYLGAPAATAEAFRPDPYGPPGARMYRTGDRARLRPDGALEFHGRRDQQLKIGGVRVEPGEIEAALAGCPGVRGAAVVAHGGALAGYVAADPGLDLGAVRDRLAAILPEALVPATLIRLDTLPVTAHGKLDRAALPPPAATASGPALAARDVRELRLSHVWARILDRPVGVRDNFFAAGGTSLRAVELIEAVRREFGTAPPLHAVFRHPTIEAMCAALGDTADELVVPLAHGPAGAPPLFLVHPQGGDCCAYLPLARELAAGTTVYGVEAVGYNTDEEPLATIEEMAARYVEEIAKVAPAGPYRLAGWSFGGNVAFEIAARLEAAGHDVAFLGVIDARAFGADRLEHWSQQRGEVERFGIIAGLPDGELAALAAAEDEREALAILLRDARRRDSVPRHADTATLRRMVAVFTANGRAADRYRTERRVAAPIHLFKATERHPTLTNPAVEPASWAARTHGGVRVTAVDGNHHDLVHPPHVASLARAIREALGP